MQLDRRRARAAASISLVLLAYLASMVLPATAMACLPYSAPSNFSFTSRLELAFVGHVVAVHDTAEQPHARITVAVEMRIAGAVPATVDVAMEAGGGCDHPIGNPGDRIVVAAGAPGADNGVFAPWTGGDLSPYNSATWVVGSGGMITSGPTLDGARLGSIAELLELLDSLPSTAMRAPLGPSAFTLLGWVLLAGSLVIGTAAGPTGRRGMPR